MRRLMVFVENFRGKWKIYRICKTCKSLLEINEDDLQVDYEYNILDRAYQVVIFNCNQCRARHVVEGLPYKIERKIIRRRNK